MYIQYINVCSIHLLAVQVQLVIQDTGVQTLEDIAQGSMADSSQSVVVRNLITDNELEVATETKQK